jgi:hypothetical protein
MLVLRGELDRALAGRFLRDAFMELQPQAECYVWHGWQSTIAMLGLSELEILVKRAFDRGFIDPHWLGFEHFQQDLEWAVKRPGEPRHPRDDQFTLFGDTVKELSHWYGFSEKFLADREQRLQQAEAEPAESEPYRNPLRGVGRNDPCPVAAARSSRIAAWVDEVASRGCWLRHRPGGPHDFEQIGRACDFLWRSPHAHVRLKSPKIAPGAQSL